MIIKSLLFIFLPFFSGTLLIHLIWQDRDAKLVLLKIFLGIGIGLGLNSLFYFIYLLFFNYRFGYLVIQVLVLIILVVLVFLRKKDNSNLLKNLKPPNYLQIFFLVVIGAIIILSLNIFYTMTMHRPYGVWDAWAMYNRTARFIFRGGIHWENAFTPELPWYFHADYPPLVALNIASGWNAIGEETLRIPMVIGGAFLFGSAGLLFAGVNAYKTLGQATLAAGALFSISGFIGVGAMQVSDIPISFFILSTGILLYIHSRKKQKELFILAGLSAGLAAWTKNEGVLFAIASCIAVLLAYRNNLKTTFWWFILGLIFPMAIVVFFKIALAPSGDLLPAPSEQIYHFINLKRHQIILEKLLGSIKSWMNWGLLSVYVLFFGISGIKKSNSAILAGFIMLILQLLGYYIIFLVTPHSLEWHLLAFPRILLQITPLFFFFYFSLVRAPESIFQSGKVIVSPLGVAKIE